MSVAVDLGRLAGALSEYTFAYLVTVGDDSRAHAIAVEPVLRDGVLDCGGAGATTSRNLARNSGVTMLWPPREPAGYTLIVDGEGVLVDGSLTVVPSRAVLHRRAAADPPGNTASAGACPHDCVPLE